MFSSHKRPSDLSDEHHGHDEGDNTWITERILRLESSISSSLSVDDNNTPETGTDIGIHSETQPAECDVNDDKLKELKKCNDSTFSGLWHDMLKIYSSPIPVFHNTKKESSHDAPKSTIEQLKENAFVFQQGDIVCCGLDHTVSGIGEHISNTLLSLVAYVSAPQIDNKGVGLPWKEAVVHIGFISFGGTVETAQIAHSRSPGFKVEPLLNYLENSPMNIWVIRSPALNVGNGQPHRVYSMLERAIFEAMMDRYTLHGKWVKMYMPPTEPDKYNFSFMLSFISLYSDALQRKMYESACHNREESCKQEKDNAVLTSELGQELGQPYSVWRHVIPFGDLLDFPAFHSLLGNEGSYCSLAVAQVSPNRVLCCLEWT